MARVVIRLAALIHAFVERFQLLVEPCKPFWFKKCTSLARPNEERVLAEPRLER